MKNHSPTVSVITPVYNGERYLEECIRSVLSQTYGDWEYVIHDNCSTDGSGEIARRFASQDPRIRVERAPKFLDMWTNHNYALRAISRESRYVKFVHADDFLYPECLERMVALADANPSVNLVSSYRLEGNVVQNDRVFPHWQTVLPGREVVGRHSILACNYVTGSPTTLLMRADIVRARQDFYDTSVWHSDTDAAFRTMMTSDVGFVHQLLTFTRMHDETGTAFSLRVNRISRMKAGVSYGTGPGSLDPSDYRKTMRRWLKDYALFLAKQMVKPYRHRQQEFHDYHRSEIEALKIDAAFDPESRAVLSLCSRFLHPSTRNSAGTIAGPRNTVQSLPVEA